jgi:hypothetical protein
MCIVLVLLLGMSSLSGAADLELPAFSVVWNGPSSGCAHSHNLTIADYGVQVNENQSFYGSVITLMYTFGEMPLLNASYK